MGNSGIQIRNFELYYRIGGVGTFSRINIYINEDTFEDYVVAVGRQLQVG